MRMRISALTMLIDKENKNLAPWQKIYKNKKGCW